MTVKKELMAWLNQVVELVLNFSFKDSPQHKNKFIIILLGTMLI